MALQSVKRTDDIFTESIQFLLLIMVIISIFIGLAVMSYPGYLAANFTRDLLFIIIAPLLSFIFFISFGIYFFKFEFSKLNKEILLFSTMVSIQGIYFALSLNTRNYLLLSALAGIRIIPTELAQFIMTSIFVPIVEEFVKIYVLIILSRQIKITSTHTKRLLDEPGLILMIGLLGGALFNLLETYWYVWNIWEMGSLTDSGIFWSLWMQVIIRSSNPLHLVASMIGAIGIITVFNSTTDLYLNRSNLRLFLPYYLVSVSLHGAWNASAGNGLSDFNFILLIVMLPAAIFIIINYGRFYQSTCEECGLRHISSISHSKTNPILGDQKSSSLFACEQCGVPKTSEICSNCLATDVFACQNCKFPLPIYASTCWKCGEEVEVIYDKLTVLDDSALNQLLRAFYFLFAFLYVGEFVFLMSSSSNSGFLPTRFVLFAMISMSLVAGIYLNINKEYDQWGFALSRFISGLILLLIGVLFYFFMVFWIALGAIVSALVLVVVGSLYCYIAIKLFIPPVVYIR